MIGVAGEGVQKVGGFGTKSSVGRHDKGYKHRSVSFSCWLVFSRFLRLTPVD